MHLRIALPGVLLATSCAGSKPSLGVVPRPGQVVSIELPQGGGRISGPVSDIGSDSLTIEAAGRSYRLSSGALQYATVVTGRKIAVRKGVTIGALIGAAAGLVLGVVEATSYECSGDCFLEGLEDMAVFAGPVLGAGIGSAVGGVIGAASTVPMWTPARPPGPSATFTADLRTGDLVRLVDSRYLGVGEVVGGSGDVVRIRFDSGVESEARVEAIERFVGMRSRGGKGMLYGAGLGALLQAAALILHDDPYDQPPGAAAASILFMTALGATVGASKTAEPVPAWTSLDPRQPATFSIGPFLRRDRIGVIGRLSW